MTLSTQLTPDALPGLLRPLAMLPNGPEMDRTFYLTWYELLKSDRVSVEEAARAIVGVLRTERFWPAPALVLDMVKRQRLEVAKAAAQAETDARLREGQTRRLAPGRPVPEPKYAVPEGYPPSRGPARAPRPAGSMPTGRIVRADGSPDPYWPEIKGRGPAWKRKALYDHGLWSWAKASAITEKAARAVPGGGIGDAVEDIDRGTH